MSKKPGRRNTPTVKWEMGLSGNYMKLHRMRCTLCYKLSWCWQSICDNCYYLMDQPLPTKKVVMIPVPREGTNESK